MKGTKTWVLPILLHWEYCIPIQLHLTQFWDRPGGEREGSRRWVRTGGGLVSYYYYYYYYYCCCCSYYDFHYPTTTIHSTTTITASPHSTRLPPVYYHHHHYYYYYYYYYYYSLASLIKVVHYITRDGHLCIETFFCHIDPS